NAENLPTIQAPLRATRRASDAPSLLLHPLIPVNPAIPRLAAHRHDVDPSIAIQVRGRQVFHRDAAVFDDFLGPLGTDAIEALVDAHAAFLAGLGTQIVADPDNQLVVAVAVQIGHPDAVAPLELLVHHVPVPELVGVARLAVDDHLVAVPGLN